MRYGNRIWALATGLAVFAASVSAGEINLGSNRHRYSVLPEAEYAEAATREAIAPAAGASWQPVNGNSLPVAYSTGTIWIRVELRHEGDAGARYYLELPSAQLKDVTVRQTGPEGSSIIQQHARSRTPAANSMSDIYPVFPITLDSVGTHTLYIRLRSDTYLGTPVYLTSSETYMRSRAIREAAVFMLLGGILFSIIFAFVQLWRLRHRLFAAALAYLLLMFIGIWTGFADATRVLGGVSPGVAEALFRPSFLLASAGILYLTYQVVGGPRRRRATRDSVLAACGLVLLLIPFSIFVGIGAVFMWALAVVMALHFGLVVALLVQSRLADSSSRAMALSWAALALFPVSSIGSRIELLPYTANLEYAFVLALPIHMSLLLGAIHRLVVPAASRPQPHRGRSAVHPGNDMPSAVVTETPESVGMLERRLHDLMNREKAYTELGLTEEKLARKCGVSRHALSGYLNHYLSTSFYAYLDSYRIPHAQELLGHDSGISVLETAYAVGYNSKTTFNRRFKDLTGMSPRDYRKRVTASQAPLDEDAEATSTPRRAILR
ncbi:MAG: helix-turn-helix domain-containing protein [Spirochaetes bacterium]|jgi:AraC-like DNA-binding protein|nr:helix-turn-helix domain-containing protein [Spirochaetota bacterium]